MHRSDGSGTSYVWVDYLAKVSPEWKQKVGVATSVNWPVGLGGKGNEGVAGLVKQTEGAIGYVEPVYATQNRIAIGRGSEHGGRVRQGVDRVGDGRGRRRGSQDAGRLPRVDHQRPGRDAYPVASFTWLLFYESPSDKDAGARPWLSSCSGRLTDGQKFAAELGYAPLPAGRREARDSRR